MTDMTIDEIITTERDNADFSKRNNHEGSADYHNKIAELLEELKAYRENSNGYNKEDIELNRNAMYNKAIDDLLEDANEMAIEVDTGTYTMKAIGIGLLEKIAEQLKEGGKNE